MSENTEQFSLRNKQAAELLNISLTTLYKVMRTDNTFPKGIKLLGCRMWLRKDLEAWMINKSKKGAK